MLLDNLSAAGYFNSDLYLSAHEFAPEVQLPEEFLRAANACLAFARDTANSLGFLSRKDIEVLVQNGMPYLFNYAEQSSRRMKMFLETEGNNASEADKADMVDLMKFVLSYASSSTETSNLFVSVAVQLSVRNLLSELGKLHFGPRMPDPSVPVRTHFSHKHGQTPRPSGQNIEMKRGDWICSRCNFMNFARNVKCLECEEARPKRQLSGGEWECPQCDFYNYARNTVCLRCDCNQPEGGISLGSTDVQTGLSYGTGSFTNMTDMDSRVAANEEKAQRWFNKVSQLDSPSDMTSAIADEDFPEIMPLRKGVNRFIVSTRRTPLERRLANAEYQKNMSSDGYPNSPSLQTEGPNKILDPNVSHGLDQVLGFSSADSTHNNNNNNNDNNSDAAAARPLKNEPAEESGRWYERVVGLYGVTEPTNAVSDDDFPETMPMRKGENRFVVSRKKDRSLTSPMYKKRVAMEQADDKNHVPFVPFPPDYFAKKDNLSVGADFSSKATDGVSTSINHEKYHGSQQLENQPTKSWKSKPSGENLFQIGGSTGYGNPAYGNSSHSSNDGWSNASQTNEDRTDLMKNSWNEKSLEGSVVELADPLDMSEEAKAQRWFQRVAQIKDISELRQIPDEDFPSIMPMRKGVNRFVVSKRKTPLERRLTSQKYRRDVGSDPMNKQGNNNN